MSIRIGSIGFGRHFRRSLLPNVVGTEDFALAAVAELDDDLRRDAARRLPGVAVYRTAEELLAESDVDAVVISTHPDAHVPLTRTGLEHGRHVFVEKPVATTAAPIQALAALAEERRRVVMTGTMWRHAPVHTVLGDWLEQQQTRPAVATVSATFPPVITRPGWDMSTLELAFYDMFVHPIDWASWLLGRITKYDAVLLDSDDDGTVVAQIRLWSEDGRLASLTLATGSRAYQISAWAQTDAGDVIEIDTKERLRITTLPTWSGTEGSFRDRATLDWEAGQLYRGWGRKGYAESFGVFSRRIREDRDHAAGLHQAAHAMGLVEGILDQLRTSQLERAAALAGTGSATA
jgi:predicted dehydrogenase